MCMYVYIGHRVIDTYTVIYYNISIIFMTIGIQYTLYITIQKI